VAVNPFPSSKKLPKVDKVQWALILRAVIFFFISKWFPWRPNDEDVDNGDGDKGGEGPGKSALCLLVLLAAQTGVGVGHLHSQLLSALHDGLALARRDAVGDLGRVATIRHHQNLKLLDVMDQEFAEAVRQCVLCFLVAAVTDVGHTHLSLEATTHTVVNTLGPSPVGLDSVVTVGLMPFELLQLLLDDLALGQRSHCGRHLSTWKKMASS